MIHSKIKLPLELKEQTQQEKECFKTTAIMHNADVKKGRRNRSKQFQRLKTVS